MMPFVNTNNEIIVWICRIAQHIKAKKDQITLQDIDQTACAYNHHHAKHHFLYCSKLSILWVPQKSDIFHDTVH
jgi:hypothetical protein